MKYGDIVLIDDIVKPNDDTGKMLAEIAGSRGYSLTFVNTEDDLNTLLSADLQSVKLILLDLNLERIQVLSENVLDQLKKKNLKVIILSVLPKTKMKRKEKYGGQYSDLPDANRLYSKGILTYIAKQELRERPEAVANVIDRSIRDPQNRQLKLVINCETASLGVVDGEARTIARKDLSGVNRDWKTAIQPKNENEIILRLLLEMGRKGTMEVRLSNVYPSETQTLRSKEVLEEELDDLSDALEVSEGRPGCRDVIHKIISSVNGMRKKLSKKSRVTKKDVDDLILIVSETLRPEKMVDRSWDAMNDFLRVQSKLEYVAILADGLTKTLDEFNKELRERSNGVVIGRLLQGPGKGQGSGIYKANIGKIELVNDDGRIPLPRLDHERISSLEKKISSIETEMSSMQNDISLMRSSMDKLEALLPKKS